MSRKLHSEEFIEKAISIHGDRYSYSMVDYKNNNTNVKIICKKHGVFEQLPTNHISGKGCKFCANNVLCTLESFILKAKKIHNNKYCYDKVEYKNINTKIAIICKIHGEFNQIPQHHLNGRGCVLCGNKIKNKERTKTIEWFKKEANKIHKNKYDYSNSVYISNKALLLITCIKHGEFKQRPDHHLSGVGCPKCKISKGESEVGSWLEKNNIIFETQKKFKDCVFESELKFDFYLPDKNLCIEYNGKQHFEPVGYFGGIEAFKKQIKRDQIKVQYCKDNKINFLTINFNENIENKLNEHVANIG